MTPYPRTRLCAGALVAIAMALLGGSLWLHPVEARAQGRAARVFVVTFEALGPGVPTVVTSEVNRELISRLETVRNLDLQTRARQGQPALRAETASPTATQNAAIDQAEGAYQAGVGLYVVEDYAGAIASLEEMMTLFDENIAEVRNWDMLIDGLAKLAESEFKSGNVEAARSTLTRVLTLRPDFAVSVETSGQAFVDLYTDVQGAVTARTAGDLRVTADVDGATIYVNGNEVGTAPVSVGDLHPGGHYVVGLGPDGRLVGQSVVVDARRGADVALELADEVMVEEADESEGDEPRYLRALRAQIRDDQINESLRPYLEELATRQGVDFIVLGAVLVDDIAVGYRAEPFIYRAEDGRFATIEGVTFDAEMSSAAVTVYTLAQNIANAVRRFPDTYVTGQPLLAAPTRVATPSEDAAGDEPEYAVPDETAFSVPVPAAPAIGGAAPAAEPSDAAGVEGAEGAEATPPTADDALASGDGSAADPVPPADPVPAEIAAPSDPVPATQGQMPAQGYPYGYPPPGYGYPPPQQGQAQGEGQAPPPNYYPYGYPPPGYGYPPPQQGQAQGEGQAPPPNYYPYGYPPPGYGYPPPQQGQTEGEGQAPPPNYPPYGYPPPGYGYPPPQQGQAQGEGQAPPPNYYPYGYPPPGYGYPPTQQGETPSYPPPAYGYGYPPPDGSDAATDDGEEGETQVAYADEGLYDDIVDDDDFDDDVDDDDKAIYEQWWFWAGSAGVVGIVAASIAIATSGDGGGSSGGFRPEVRW